MKGHWCIYGSTPPKTDGGRMGSNPIAFFFYFVHAGDDNPC